MNEFARIEDEPSNCFNGENFDTVAHKLQVRINNIIQTVKSDSFPLERKFEILAKFVKISITPLYNYRDLSDCSDDQLNLLIETYMHIARLYMVLLELIPQDDKAKYNKYIKILEQYIVKPRIELSKAQTKLMVKYLSKSYESYRSKSDKNNPDASDPIMTSAVNVVSRESSSQLEQPITKRSTASTNPFSKGAYSTEQVKNRIKSLKLKNLDTGGKKKNKKQKTNKTKRRKRKN